MTLIELENAIAAALEPLKASAGVATVRVASEKAESVEKLLAALGTRPPFVAVLYGGGELRPVNLAAGVYDHRPEYTLLIGVSQLRSNEAGRSGLYPILADALAALSGQKLGLAIEPIALGRVDLLNWGQGLMIYAVRLTTRFAWNVTTEAT